MCHNYVVFYSSVCIPIQFNSVFLSLDCMSVIECISDIPYLQCQVKSVVIVVEFDIITNTLRHISSSILL